MIFSLIFQTAFCFSGEAKANDFKIEPYLTNVVTRKSPPLFLAGVQVNPLNPWRLSFTLYSDLPQASNIILKQDVEVLVKYFLTCLTLPENELWVNLSPYEKDRVMPPLFAKTLMGKSLLSQDYVLKQVSSVLLDPRRETGKIFWSRVYKESKQQWGTTKIAVRTHQKIWVLADAAHVIEDEHGAMISSSSLKVMMDDDELALSKSKMNTQHAEAGREISDRAFKTLMLPVLYQLVNEDKAFIPLRQIYSAFILASWYKKSIKNNLIQQRYVNQHKLGHLDSTNNKDIERIYQAYMKSFKDGAFHYIDDQDKTDLPRKYISGGAKFDSSHFHYEHKTSIAQMVPIKPRIIADVKLISDQAMAVKNQEDNDAEDLKRALDPNQISMLLENKNKLLDFETAVSNLSLALSYYSTDLQKKFVPIIEPIRLAINQLKDEINALEEQAGMGSSELLLKNLKNLDQKLKVQKPEINSLLLGKQGKAIDDFLLLYQQIQVLIQTCVRNQAMIVHPNDKILRNENNESLSEYLKNRPFLNEVMMTNHIAIYNAMNNPVPSYKDVILFLKNVVPTMLSLEQQEFLHSYWNLTRKELDVVIKMNSLIGSWDSVDKMLNSLSDSSSENVKMFWKAIIFDQVLKNFLLKRDEMTKTETRKLTLLLVILRLWGIPDQGMISRAQVVYEKDEQGSKSSTIKNLGGIKFKSQDLQLSYTSRSSSPRTDSQQSHVAIPLDIPSFNGLNPVILDLRVE